MAGKKRSSRSKTSNQWLKAHFDDTYVKQAQKQGYRSRAVFKLLEIQENDHIFRKGMAVIDLGAAPGGWSQVASELVGVTGMVIATDILPMDPIPQVDFVQGDFTEPTIYNKLLEVIGDRKVELVMSDMAPNISGMKAVDQPRAMYMAELALDLAQNVLSHNGNFLVKVFQGEGFDSYFKTLREEFSKVITRKPKASKPSSREVYLLAKGYLK